MVCGLGTARCHIAADLKNPNRDTMSNRELAGSRVTGGAIRCQGGTLTTPAEEITWPPRSLGHKVALLLLVGAVAVTAIPEIARSMRGWPLNEACYLPVVGPGDRTKVYMPEKVSSIKGYWNGNPQVLLRVDGTGGARGRSVRRRTQTTGAERSASSPAKNNSSRPWVKLEIPDDASLAGKAVQCDITLEVRYPEMSR